MRDFRASRRHLLNGFTLSSCGPISNDAVDGAAVIANLAMIYTWVGDIDSAIERLAFLGKMPGGPDYGQLKFDPAWDALRRDGRFAKIVDGLRPASAHQ